MRVCRIWRAVCDICAVYMRVGGSAGRVGGSVVQFWRGLCCVGRLTVFRLWACACVLVGSFRDDDCMTADSEKSATTVCNYFDGPRTSSDGSATFNWGFCTQCAQDCDCGFNEVCTPWVQIIDAWWTKEQWDQLSKQDHQEMTDKLASSVHGTWKLPGQCKNINSLNSRPADQSKIIGEPCNPHIQTPTSLTGAESGKSYCGHVYQWQPQYLKCVGRECPKDPKDQTLQNPKWGQPGQCGAMVNGTSQPLPCSGGTSWSGTCHQKTCEICVKHDSSHCTNTVCKDHHWEQDHPYDATVRTYWGYKHNPMYTTRIIFLTATMLVAGAVFYKIL